MSSRERWIVYPLLFLTLGIAMRDKIIHPNHLQTENIAAAQIRCGQLTADSVVCDRAQALGAVATPTVNCRELTVTGTNDRRAVVIAADPRTNVGVVKTDIVQCREVGVMGDNSRPTVIAFTDPKTKAGAIVTFSAKGVPESQIPSRKPGKINDNGTSPDKPQTPPGSPQEPAPSSPNKTSP
jgi:hypothetical protein